MQHSATLRDDNPGRDRSSRRYSYQKVVDNRKHPIRGLWRRNGKFFARLTVETADGRKKIQWAPLDAVTVAEAQAGLRTLLVERENNTLRQLSRSPRFTDYLNQTYLPLLATSGKKPGTIVTEMTHYKRWDQALGHLRLDKIRASQVAAVLHDLRGRRSARTTNVALVCLRHVLKAAKRDHHIKVLPVEDIAWQRTETKARRLYTLSLPTSFSCSLESFYSFAHPHQPLPAAPDRLPTRFAIVLAADKSTQTCQRPD